MMPPTLASLAHFCTIAILSLPSVASQKVYPVTTAGSVNYTALYSPCLSAKASIYYATQPDYNTSVLQRASVWDAPIFAVTIKPATDGDVQCVVSQQRPIRHTPMMMWKLLNDRS